MRTLLWLNIDVAFSSTSKISTASAGAPSSAMTRELDEQGKQDLDRVEAHAGRHVDVEVGVMHAVQPPQHRHRMEQHVLQIDGKIEQNHGHERRGDEGNGDDVEQSPAARLAHQRDADGSGRKENADQKDIDGEDAEIAGPARTSSRRQGGASAPRAPTGPLPRSRRKSQRAGPAHS